jgi:hypothetical protein
LQGEGERKENTVVKTMHLTRKALRDLMREDPSLHVVGLTKSGTVCLAQPGALVTKQGDQVIFANWTGDKLRMFFPEAGPFAELKGVGSIVEVPEGAQVGAFTVTGDKQKKSNVYPYAVFCAVNEAFAIASSNPEIIIDW